TRFFAHLADGGIRRFFAGLDVPVHDLPRARTARPRRALKREHAPPAREWAHHDHIDRADLRSGHARKATPLGGELREVFIEILEQTNGAAADGLFARRRHAASRGL